MINFFQVDKLSKYKQGLLLNIGQNSSSARLTFNRLHPTTSTLKYVTGYELG